MAKFDVYQDKANGGYLLDCQADILSDLKTRFVIPLIPADQVRQIAARLNPIFEIGDVRYTMATNLAGTAPVTALGLRVTSLRDKDTAIGNAIDMLLSGY